MEKWWAFWRYIKPKIHSICSSPRAVSPMCLSPCFRLLRLYTAEQNNGSLEDIDALLGMGNGLFIEPARLPCSCARSAQISSSCTENCAVCEGGWDALCPQSAREAGESCCVWGWNGWWALLQTATGIHTGFDERLGLCKDQSTQSNIHFSCSVPGCPLYLTDLEVEGKLDSLSKQECEFLCSLLFYALNWFREVSRALSVGSGVEGWGKPRRAELGQPGGGKPEGRKYCGLYYLRERLCSISRVAVEFPFLGMLCTLVLYFCELTEG